LSSSAVTSSASQASLDCLPGPERRYKRVRSVCPALFPNGKNRFFTSSCPRNSRTSLAPFRGLRPLTNFGTLCRLSCMGSESPRITTQTLTVLSAFITSGRELAGSEIAKGTKLHSGTLYPILFRLEESGWLESRWEESNASELGRPRRRIYKLTGAGARAATAELGKTAAVVGGLSWGTS
jgi:PadR family transcriptional regulator, regulatory protein PadR